MFSKVLIANRGEIACRIIRTAKKLGIGTIAICSEVDREALHTLLADETYVVGPAPAIHSYLHIDRIIEVARSSGAEAIHPGYGFLSENPEFAERCTESGLAFIGPPAEVIATMGIKSQAKAIMEWSGIPVIPGGCITDMGPEERNDFASSIGYPLLIKADLGGGGKGIRLVHDASELDEGVAVAAREAAGAFGDTTLLLEKQVTSARHIEVQIFRDSHGNSLHLFERDCSMQRRHQKIVEEAPAPGLDTETREGLHRAAVLAADAVGYQGAGTVEFLVGDDGHYYFLEMNTRLQVEHPVTEMITGLDLVEWQFLVAAKQALPLCQEEIRARGHAIEVRIYAEDPARNFFPSSGTISYLREPVQSATMRLDSGIATGDVITPNYDPILAKMIGYGDSRNEALTALASGMRDYRLAGLTTNLNFLQNLVASPIYQKARHTTLTIDSQLDAFLGRGDSEDEDIALAGLFCFLENRRPASEGGELIADPFSPWSGGSGFRLNHDSLFICRLSRGEKLFELRASPKPEGIEVRFNKTSHLFTEARLVGSLLVCRLEGRNLEPHFERDQNCLTMFFEGRTMTYAFIADVDLFSMSSGEEDGLRAPIPGNVTEVYVEDGSEVKKGDPILALEAMKMEYSIRAPANGKVLTVLFTVGDAVQERQRLAEFEALAEDEDGDESS